MSNSDIREVVCGNWTGRVEFRYGAGSLALFRSDGECRGFWRLALGNGCPLRCKYCYLLGTFPWLQFPVIYADQGAIRKRIEHYLARSTQPFVLNVGELSDSLVFDGLTHFTSWAVPLFAAQSKGTLLLLTKTDQFAGLLQTARSLPKPIPNVIVSWSLNASAIAEQYEGIAASVNDRLIAATVCQEAGYRIRFRIDPLIPVPGWREKYGILVEKIARYGLKPDRITLGSLRFLNKTHHVVKSADPALAAYCSAFDNGRWRIPVSDRVEMYEAVAALVRSWLGLEAALCKESEELRKLVNLSGPCHCEV